MCSLLIQGCANNILNFRSHSVYKFLFNTLQLIIFELFIYNKTSRIRSSINSRSYAEICPTRHNVFGSCAINIMAYRPYSNLRLVTLSSLIWICVGISQGKLSRKFSEIWNLNKSIANIVLTVYIENIINTATISGIVVLHSPKAGMEGKEKEI